MPKTQADIDAKMKADYERILKNILTNISRVERLEKEIEQLIYDKPKNTGLYLICKDLQHILDSIRHVKKSCESIYNDNQGVGNNYVVYTTFYREILSTIKLIMDRVKKINKSIFENDARIKTKHDSIKAFLGKGYEWRNKLEHGIDPFYEREYQEILKQITPDKVLFFTEKFMELLNMLKNSQQDADINAIDLNIQFVISLLDRKKALEENNQIAYSNFEMINELSLKVMRLEDRKEILNVLNVGMKYSEFSKMIKYTYEFTDNANITNSKEYDYFTRSALTFCYQVYDKMGFYINEVYLLKNKSTYFKAMVEVVKKNKDLSDDTFLNKCVELKNSNDYLVLNILRQGICHEVKLIDYKKDSAKLSSLLVSNYIHVSELVNLILIHYFKKNSLEVSKRSKKEVNGRTNFVKL